MNTRHLILTVAFGIGMLEPATAHAQDSVAATAGPTAKLRNSTLPRSSALPRRSVLDRRRSQLLVVDTKTVSKRTPVNDERELGDRGELVEALLRWTDRLVIRLESARHARDSVPAGAFGRRRGHPNPIPQEWRPIPRVRPVQLPGATGWWHASPSEPSPMLVTCSHQLSAFRAIVAMMSRYVARGNRSVPGTFGRTAPNALHCVRTALLHYSALLSTARLRS